MHVRGLCGFNAKRREAEERRPPSVWDEWRSAPGNGEAPIHPTVPGLQTKDGLLRSLKALPTGPYQYAEWKKCRVAPDYHVEIADHYYSVPSRLIREQLEARITDTTVEILHKGIRVASHARSYARRRHTTIPEHMPSAHRRY